MHMGEINLHTSPIRETGHTHLRVIQFFCSFTFCVFKSLYFLCGFTWDDFFFNY